MPVLCYALLDVIVHSGREGPCPWAAQLDTGFPELPRQKENTEPEQTHCCVET